MGDRGSAFGTGRTHSGFTLIELLVVMAILLLLAFLLFPALANAKRQARSVSCLGNLKQWGLATHLYAAAHNDYLPPEGFPNPSSESQFRKGWYFALPRVLDLPDYWFQPWRTNSALDPGRSVWICPSNPRRSNGRNLFHYCLNEGHDGSGPQDRERIRMGTIEDPVKVVWLFDSKNKPALGSVNFVHTNLHSGGAQFLFLDGHAVRRERRDYWDPILKKGRLDHPELVWEP